MSRRGQKIGLVVGLLLYWLDLGLLVGLAHPRDAGVGAWRVEPRAPRSRSWPACLAGRWRSFRSSSTRRIRPASAEPDSIGYRQTLYIGFMALSVLGLALATAIRRRTGGWLAPVIFYAVWALGIYFLMPPNPDPDRAVASRSCGRSVRCRWRGWWSSGSRCGAPWRSSSGATRPAAGMPDLGLVPPCSGCCCGHPIGAASMGAARGSASLALPDAPPAVGSNVATPAQRRSHRRRSGPDPSEGAPADQRVRSPAGRGRAWPPQLGRPNSDVIRAGGESIAPISSSDGWRAKRLAASRIFGSSVRSPAVFRNTSRDVEPPVHRPIDVTLLFERLIPGRVSPLGGGPRSARRAT